MFEIKSTKVYKKSAKHSLRKVDDIKNIVLCKILAASLFMEIWKKISKILVIKLFCLCN